MYHAPPMTSLTVMFDPATSPAKSPVGSMSPQTLEGCSAGGAVPSRAPNVKKLSAAKSGKAPKNNALTPWAFQDGLAGLLNHVPDVVSRMKGLVMSPEHELK